MKALLQKDIYVLSSQAKLFLVMAVVFSFSRSLEGFAAVYAALLPYSAIAYDERSKWDQLAAMLPYSTRDIVLSKYVLGYCSIFCMSLVSLATKVIMGVFLHTAVSYASALPMACAGALTLALALPFMLRFGVEKGRVIFTFGMAAAAVGSASALSYLTAQGVLLTSSTFTWVFLAVAVVANLLSIAISIRLYPRRTR